MIYKAQFETKRSRIDYDACDIRFSVGLSKEDFDHLRTNLLEESKYIKPYLHMLDRRYRLRQIYGVCSRREKNACAHAVQLA